MSVSPPRRDVDEDEGDPDPIEAIRRSLADLGLGGAVQSDESCPARQLDAPAFATTSGGSGGHSGSSSSSCPRRQPERPAPASETPVGGSEDKKQFEKTPGAAASGSPSPAASDHFVGEHGYVVWANPADTSVIGVHFGGFRAWSYIVARLPGANYHNFYSYCAGVRLCRFEADVDGRAVYNFGAELYRSPLPALEFTH